MSVYVCVCMWGEGLCGQFSQFIILKNQNPPTPPPHPPLQVMNNDQPPFSYLFIYIFYSFILFIYLFIFNYFFFTKGEYQKELFYLTYLGSVPINLCLAFIWMRFGILLYREVRKKWFPSERRVSHM